MERQRKSKGTDWTGYNYEYGSVLSENSVGKWDVKCNLCNKVHILSTRTVRNNGRSKTCFGYKSWNWTGLDRWDAIIRRTYGITLDDYYKILKDQGGGCKLCGRTEDQEGRKLAIDHCHTSGNIRGILCANCNQALGLLYDSTSTMQRAIEYIKYANAR